MAGPWERYAQTAPQAQTEPQAGPWSKYAAQPSETKPQGQPEANSLADFAMAVPSGITKGLMGVVALPRTLNDLAAKGADWATGEQGHRSLAKDIGLPTYEDVKGGFEGAVSKVGRDVFGKEGQATLPEAQGVVPKLIETGASFAAPIPGAQVEKLAGYGTRFASGVGSEGLGQVFKDTSLEVPARIAGAVVAPAALSAAKSAIVPTAKASAVPLAQRAEELGVPLSLNQVAPSKMRTTVQKVSQALPFSGVDDFTVKQRGAWNKAVAKTLGMDADSLTPDVVNKFLDDSGTGFTNILAGKTLNVDRQAIKDLNAITKDASSALERGTLAVVRRNVLDLKKNIKKGVIPGEKLSNFRSELLKRIPRSPSGAKEYLGDLVTKIDDLAAAGMSGDEAVQLKTLRRQWRNWKTLEPLLEKATDGVINPTELMNKVQASKYIKNARLNVGDDDLVDLARIGKEFLPIPGGSDTYEKLTTAGALVSTPIAAVTNPIPTAGAVAGLGLNRAFQSLVNQNPRAVRASLQKAVSSNPSLGASIQGASTLPLTPRQQAIQALTGSATMQNNPSLMKRLGKAIDEATDSKKSNQGGYLRLPGQETIKKNSDEVVDALDPSHAARMARADDLGKKSVVFGTDDPFVYHTTDKRIPISSFSSKGIVPSKKGLSGEGVYMANTIDNTYGYHVSPEEGMTLRINKEGLLKRFGKYSKDNPNGIEFDETNGEILLGGKRSIPPELVEYLSNGKWNPLISKSGDKLSSRPESAVIAGSLAGGASIGNYLGQKEYDKLHPKQEEQDMPKPNSAGERAVEAPSSDRQSYLQRLYQVESGNKVNAQAKTSSAAGLAQFTKGTWLSYFDRVYPKLKGLTAEQKLQKRFDPVFMETMTNALTDDNEAALRKADIPVNDTTRYLAHFFGYPIAIKVLNSPANARITPQIVGEGPINSNPTILRGKTAEQVVQWAKKKMSGPLPNTMLASNI